MRRPRDDTGGLLLMALPQLVVHKLDAASPLVPAETYWCKGASKLARAVAFCDSFADLRRRRQPSSSEVILPSTNAAARHHIRSTSLSTKQRIHRRRPSVESRMFAPFTHTASHVSDDFHESNSEEEPSTPPPRQAHFARGPTASEDAEFRAALMRSSSTATRRDRGHRRGLRRDHRPRLVQARAFRGCAIENFAWWRVFASVRVFGSRAGRAWWTSRNFIGRWNRARTAVLPSYAACDLNRNRRALF